MRQKRGNAKPEQGNKCIMVISFSFERWREIRDKKVYTRDNGYGTTDGTENVIQDKKTKRQHEKISIQEMLLAENVMM